jgi:2-keto-4-pentenoate hydratase/2-oxohepta-3-ene-1,7-dioic acid hydratase in catechol pathway
MRIARIATRTGRHHVVGGTDGWLEVADPFAAVPQFTGNEFPFDAVRLLAPVQPLVVLGMAHNGPGDRELPPQAFLKSPRTVVGPDDDILVDERLGQVNVEGELAVVIRQHCRNLTPEEVPAAILGYTIGNDVTAVDQVALDEKMTQAKHGDGFTPLGPWIETDLDPSSLPIIVRVNGRHQAGASTADLAWNITEQLVYLTSYLSLGPGDVVLTGAPGTFTPVKPGDHGELEIGGIGALSNPVRASNPVGAR